MENETAPSLGYLERVENSVNLDDLKKKLIAEFSDAISSAEDLEDLVSYLYRDPVCQHMCGVSWVFLGVLGEFGIDETVFLAYRDRYFEAQSEKQEKGV